MKLNSKGQEFEVPPFFLFAKEKSAGCSKKKNRFIVMNQKGQEFEVFNILVGAVLALAILVIIISIITYFEQIKLDSSIQSIQQKLTNAAQSPDGSVFVSKDVIIPADYSFNSKQFSLILNIDEECIEFDFPHDLTSIYYPNSPERNVIAFNKRIQTNFFVVCQSRNDGVLYFSDYSLMQCPASCDEFCCLASFGINPAVVNDQS